MRPGGYLSTARPAKSEAGALLRSGGGFAAHESWRHKDAAIQKANSATIRKTQGRGNGPQEALRAESSRGWRDVRCAEDN